MKGQQKAKKGVGQYLEHIESRGHTAVGLAHFVEPSKNELRLENEELLSIKSDSKTYTSCSSSKGTENLELKKLITLVA